MTNREGSARFAIWFGVALIALGLISLLGLTYSFLILLGGVGAVSAVAGALSLARIRRTGRAGWLDRHVGLLACVLLAVVSVLSASMTGIEHEVVHEMTWEVGPPASDRPSQAHVILRFTQYPGYHIDMYSNDLLAYLESQPAQNTLVTFVVTTDFGHLRGFRPTMIGDRAVEPSWTGAYGSTGNAGRSPFDAWD